MTVKWNANSFYMDDMEASLHPVNNYIRSRLSHTATPENSLPKESTILEEDWNDAYLMMSHVEQPPSTSYYLCMMPRGPLYSSPSAPSVSTMIGSSRTLSNTSIRGGYKNGVTPVPCRYAGILTRICRVRWRHRLGRHLLQVLMMATSPCTHPEVLPDRLERVLELIPDLAVSVMNLRKVMCPWHRKV